MGENQSQPRILVTDSISEDALGLLSNSGAYYEYKPEISAEDLRSAISSFEAVIVRSRTKITRDIIDNGKKLRVIGRAGVGVDNIDTAAAKEKGIVVLNTPSALTNAVAEFTIGLMLDLSRMIPQADASMKQGKWEKSRFHGAELQGKTYGTIGIGRIGQKVAELAKSFGMKIMANDVIPIPKDLIERLQIEVSGQSEVFSKADFVDLHVPLAPDTVNLVNYQRLKTMKRTSYLINTSRGKVVNEEDLLKALDEKLIAGAALDVYETEPPARMELVKRDNVIATPHIAGQTVEAQKLAGTEVVQLVLKALQGK